MSEITTPTARGNSGSTTDRLASMAHESIDRVSTTANRAETEMRDTVAKTTEGAKELEERALDTAKVGLHQTQAYIEKNPLMSAGIAFAAGALLSVLIRR
jgi:ElaB/YqjD/DUF883 family membrane-anchored ribosome-binding protein